MFRVMILVSIISFSLLAQSSDDLPFTDTDFGIYGGVIRTPDSPAGSQINFELKTNFYYNTKLWITTGYAKYYDGRDYSQKFYSETNSAISAGKYVTRLLEVNQIEYRSVPVIAGIEYMYSEYSIKPFVSAGAGYDFSSSVAEGKNHQGIAGYFNSVSEIPLEYRNPSTVFESGSAFVSQLSFGAIYNMTDYTRVRFMYTFYNNSKTINSNRIFFGISI